MKKMLIWILLATTSCAAFSQKIDTICVDRPDLVRKLKQLETLKVQVVEMNQVKEQNSELALILAVKDQRIDNYELQVLNYMAQVKIKDDVIGSLNRQLKRQKTKTFFVGAGALLLGLTFLFNR
jgi:protein-disulfide isomerase